MTSVVNVEEMYEALDPRTVEILKQRRRVRTPKRRAWLVRRALLAADLAGLTFAFAVAQQLYSANNPLCDFGELTAFAISLPGWVVGAKLYGLYERDEEGIDHSTADDFSGIFHLVTVCTFVLFAVSRETRWFEPQFSKLFLFWLLAIIGLTTGRVAARSYCHRHLSYQQNTIIVGAGDVGQLVAQKLLRHPEYGMNLVGFVDSNPKERTSDLGYLSLLGSKDDLPHLIDLLDVERVIVAFSNDSHQDLLDLIRTLNELSLQVYIVPRFFDVLGHGMDMHAVEGLPLCSLPPARLSRSSRFVKRILDVAAAGLALLVFAPLLVVVAVAIKLTSPGPIFFRQERIGAGGRTFRIWKFRSMVVDADEQKHVYAHLNRHLLPGGDPRMFKIENDPRITAFGRVLRRFSIDELPQLLNVLRGEMSLVGPRPLVMEEHGHVEKWGLRRLDILPGLTGLWQVLGRSQIPFSEMVRLDYVYVTSWSVMTDIRLILQTIPVIFRKRGAL